MCLVSLGLPGWLRSVCRSSITWEAGRFAVPYMRMLISLNALLVLAFSSRIQDLMHELQAFGRMAWIHVPLTVAVRFCPPSWTTACRCATLSACAALWVGKAYGPARPLCGAASWCP